MTDDTAVQAVLLDAFSRIRQLVQQVTDDLSVDRATYRPDGQANTVAWLVWHLTRIQDDHVADVAGVEQVWTARGWSDRIDLPFDAGATGYGQDADDVAAVRIDPSELAAYHLDVHAMTTAFVSTVSAGDLARVVDERWDPPVTLSVRLVSVISDCLQHLGQAAYVRGLADRLT